MVFSEFGLALCQVLCVTSRSQNSQIICKENLLQIAPRVLFGMPIVRLTVPKEPTFHKRELLAAVANQKPPCNPLYENSTAPNILHWQGSN